MSVSRRHFLKQAGAMALGFSGLQLFSRCGFSSSQIPQELISEAFGPLIEDPAGIFDLPEGFSYKIISRFRDVMDDGFYVPHRPDGMATFPGPDGLTILIRNHEVNAARGGDESAFGSDFALTEKMNPGQFYDYGHNNNPGQGGTTTIVYDTGKQEVVRQYLSLAGTLRNCAGGPTPWNTWLTCEEIVMEPNDVYARHHGYVFEVPASTEIGLADPKPIKAMGRFNHEAVAVDPTSGVIYLTEDDSEGLLYRFIPNEKENMHAGGTLQALAVFDQPGMDTRNWSSQAIETGDILPVRWIDLEDVDSPDDDLRYRGFEDGAARFARGEGMWYGNDAVYFACTNGGRKKLGQIWKYSPSPEEGVAEETSNPGNLELFAEPNSSTIIENADNLTVAPWGDLIVCEDCDSKQDLCGITPDGNIYKFGRNAKSNSELAGAVFSPDGSTLFMNIQHAGLTLAITGPWDKAVAG